MKHLLIIITSILIFSCNHSDNHKRSVKYLGDFSSYKGIDSTKILFIEQYQVDLDFDNQADTIILETLDDLTGDPQIFTIVRIKLATGNEFVINNIGGYTQDNRTKKKYPNRINSDKIYIPEFNKYENYLIIWDYQYPSCDAIVTVFKINKEGLIQVLKKSFYISEINDFNKDGKIDFLGKLTCEEKEKVSIVTIE